MNPYGYPYDPYGYPPAYVPPVTTTTYVTPVAPVIPTTTYVAPMGIPPPVVGVAPPMVGMPPPMVGVPPPGYPIGYGAPPPVSYNYPTGPSIPGINGYSQRSISGHKFRSGFKVRHENRYPF